MERFGSRIITLKNGRVVKYKLLSWRYGLITSNCAERDIIRDEYGKIISVVFDEELEISVPNNFEIEFNGRKYPMKITELFLDNNKLYFYESTLNISYKLLLGGLNIDKELVANPYFMNSYLHISEEENNGKYIYLVYKYVDDDEYKQLEGLLQSHKQFVKIIEPDHNYTIYKFVFPIRVQGDIQRFWTGSYSSYTNTMKRSILRFHGAGKKHKIGQILYKDDELKDQLEKMLNMKIPENIDLFEKPSVEKETFEYEYESVRRSIG